MYKYLSTQEITCTCCSHFTDLNNKHCITVNIVFQVPAICSVSLRIQDLDTGGILPESDVVTTIITTSTNHSEVEIVIPSEDQHNLTVNVTNRAGMTMKSLLLSMCKIHV